MEKHLSETISVDIRKVITYLPLSLFQDKLEHSCASFLPYEDWIMLFYGKLFKSLCLKYHRTIEENTCVAISHEVLHRVLFKEQNIKVCSRFDNIAESLSEYGVY